MLNINIFILHYIMQIITNCIQVIITNFNQYQKHKSVSTLEHHHR